MHKSSCENILRRNNELGLQDQPLQKHNKAVYTHSGTCKVLRVLGIKYRNKIVKHKIKVVNCNLRSENHDHESH